MSVVIYDSGVGGLSEPELKQRVTQVVEQIAARYGPSILVVACNTASTVLLPSLRKKFEFDIVGVVPAIKPAAAISKTRSIGLLATQATVTRSYTNTLIDTFASDCQVIRVGSHELVEMAERKLRGQTLDLEVLGAILAPFLQTPELDVVVLACTHFPLLREEIASCFAAENRLITLVDSSVGIANRVRQLSDELVDIKHQENRPHDRASFTGKLDDPKLLEHLIRLGFSDTQILAV